jgi:hypothetical protein
VPRSPAKPLTSTVPSPTDSEIPSQPFPDTAAMRSRPRRIPARRRTPASAGRTASASQIARRGLSARSNAADRTANGPRTPRSWCRRDAATDRRRRRRCFLARGGSGACSTSANANGCAGPKRSPDGSDRDERFATKPVTISARSTPHGAAGFGQAQSPNHPTLAWLLSTMGDNAERAQAADAQDAESIVSSATVR